MFEYLNRRYALAYYQVAEEKGKIEEYIKDLRDLVELLDTNEDLIQIVKHPQISSSKKKEMFIEIFTGKVNADLISFVNILVGKAKVHTLNGVLDQIEKIQLEANLTVIAHVKSVVPLIEEEKENLITNLKAKYNKNILLEEELDNSIIGGVYLRVGDDVIDGTIKHKLEEIQKLMLKDKLEVVKE